ncbi:MAG: hypothetical protein EXS25_10665 [Pedosphaera sp.]|nr:hypothetical protein [Pedosphaera sp.]
MNSRLIHLAVLTALSVTGLLAQVPAVQPAPLKPSAPLNPALPGIPSNPVAPSGNPFSAFSVLPARPKATNAPVVSTNLPSALPRAFPRMTPTPKSPAITPNPGAGTAPGQPTAAAKAAEEDKALNDLTVKSLKGLRGTNTSPDQVQIKFKNMDLNQFLDQVYGPAVHRTVLRAQSLPQVQINVNTQTDLTEEEQVQMYDTILALNGITMIPTGSKFVTAVVAAQAMQEGAAFSNQSSEKYPEASQFVTHVAQLKHVSVEEVIPIMSVFAKNPTGIVAIASTKTLILRDYAINVKRMLEVLARIDIEVEENFQLEVIPIKYGKVDEIYATLTSVIGGGGVSGSPGGSGMGGMGGNRRGMGGGMGGGMGSGIGGGMGGNQFGGGQYGNNNRGGNRFNQQQQQGAVGIQNGAVGGAGSFQGRLNSLSRGQGGAGYGGLSELLQTVSITADTRSNSLIVYGNKKDIAKLKEVLVKVDTLLPQVLVEAIIMEVALSDAWNYGLSAAQRPAQFGSNPNNRGGGVVNDRGSLGTGSDFLKQLGRTSGGSAGTNVVNGIPNTAGAGLSYFTQIGQNWDFAITAIAADSRVNVIQRPRVITSHATAGRFFVGSAVPYLQSSGYSGGGGGFGGFGGGFGGGASVGYMNVGVTLNVTPYITPDNLVVMEVEQTVANLGANLDLGVGASSPTTQSRETSSFVTVRDKDAVLLGGYITTSTEKKSSGVPLLRDIPYLGAAFSRRSRDKSRTELMILIRPSILQTPADAGAVADDERERLPGVRIAEQEFEDGERQEAKKAKRQLKEK